MLMIEEEERITWEDIFDHDIMKTDIYNLI